jgi:hypothetical protein
MTAELFEWIEIIVYENIKCEKYYYLYERLCNN